MVSAELFAQSHLQFTEPTGCRRSRPFDDKWTGNALLIEAPPGPNFRLLGERRLRRTEFPAAAPRRIFRHVEITPLSAGELPMQRFPGSGPAVRGALYEWRDQPADSTQNRDPTEAVLIHLR